MTTAADADDSTRDDSIAARRSKHLPFAMLAVEVARNPDISPQAKALYMVLATYADVGTRETFVSRRVLARDLGLSRRESPVTPLIGTAETTPGADDGKRSITRWAAELEKANVVRIEPRKRRDGSQTSNRYVLNDAHLIWPRVAPGSGAESQRRSTIKRLTDDDPWAFDPWAPRPTETAQGDFPF